MNNKSDERAMGGVFLIGLALLALTGYWWPGIMFVIGAAMIARTAAQGREWTSDHSALIVIGIGLVFAVLQVVGAILSAKVIGPLVLIALGLWFLFGRNGRWSQNAPWMQGRSRDVRKSKNDDLV